MKQPTSMLVNGPIAPAFKFSVSMLREEQDIKDKYDEFKLKYRTVYWLLDKNPSEPVI